MNEEKNLETRVKPNLAYRYGKGTREHSMGMNPGDEIEKHELISWHQSLYYSLVDWTRAMLRKKRREELKGKVYVFFSISREIYLDLIGKNS